MPMLRPPRCLVGGSPRATRRGEMMVLMSILIVVGSPLSAAADTYRFTIEQSQSSVAGTAASEVDLAGTFKGDWDPKANPDGTRTLPGLFGGSGNQPIPYTGTLSIDGDLDHQPIGSFILAFDFPGMTVAMADLAVDLLGGSPALSEAIFTILYQTFRTFQPDSLFPGGSPVSLPLGEVAVTELLAVQSAPAEGAITEIDPNVYDFVISGMVMMFVTVEANGEPTELEPFEVPFLMTGTATINGPDALISLNIEIEIEETQQGPFKGGSFENVPVDVPTVLPPGETAHLLFSGDVQQITIAVDLAVNGVADGVQIHVPAELVDWTLIFGTLIDGGLDELRVSDDQYLHLRSVFGFSAQEPNLLSFIVHAETAVAAPELLMLVVEGRLNNPGGSASLSLRNWDTGLLQTVHQFALGLTEIVETVGEIDAADRVHPSDGRIDLGVRISVIATFSASGFEAFIDHTAVIVD